MSQVDLFLKQLKSEAANLVPVFIPSLNKTMNFTPITVQQQKNIIKNTLGGVNGNLQLQVTLNNIILDNATEYAHDITILDRSAILIQLRTAYLGTKVADSGELKQVLPAQFTYPDTEEITEEGITVTVGIPVLSRDSNYITFMTSGKVYGNPGDLVNEMYITEVAKFITKISFKDIVIEPSMADGLRIVNELPTKLITKIMLYIKKIKDIDNEWLITKSGKQVILGTQFFNDPV